MINGVIGVVNAYSVIEADGFWGMGMHDPPNRMK